MKGLGTEISWLREVCLPQNEGCQLTNLVTLPECFSSPTDLLALQTTLCGRQDNVPSPKRSYSNPQNLGMLFYRGRGQAGGMCPVIQLCLTLCDPMDCSPSSSSVHGTLQARILEWVAMSSSRGIFPTQGSNLCLLPASPALASGFFTT